MNGLVGFAGGERKYDEKDELRSLEKGDERGFRLGCPCTQRESNDAAGNGRGTCQSSSNLLDVGAIDAA